MKKFKIPHGSKKFNMMSMNGGKYLVKNMKKFLNVFKKSYVKFTQSNVLPLVFRGPRNKDSMF